jgi:DNA-binding transcriptional LysR family regulator
MNFTLKQMQVFLAVVNHGSTLAAAIALGISQPAVSSAIAGLESNLNTQLFHRWKKRMVINERGRNLIPMARSLLANAREVDQMFGSGDSQISGTLRIGTSRTVASYVVPEILSGFAVEHPAVKMEIISKNKTGIISQVEDFSLDVGIIAGAGDRPDLKNQLWLTDELCVIASPKHPISRKKKVTPKDLADCDWILREEGSGTLEVLYNAMPEEIKPFSVLMVMDNLEAIKRTVEHVEAISCVSRFAIQREVGRGVLQIISTPYLDLRRKYSFLIHREKERSLLLNYFINHCYALTDQHKA